MKCRVHVFVSGMVQGVFFRAATARLAQRLELTGWVRNLDDGRVEAVFEGEKDAVDKVVEFCRHGPNGAFVQDLDVRLEDWKGEFKAFVIVRWPRL
jgi:acylphosphatase